MDRFRLALRGKRFDRSLRLTATSNDFVIEHLRGGISNRVLAYHRHAVSRGEFHSCCPESTTVVGRFPGIRSSDPTFRQPVHFNTSPRNQTIGQHEEQLRRSMPFKVAYKVMIFRMQTKPYYYPNLSHEHKCVVAREHALSKHIEK